MKIIKNWLNEYENYKTVRIIIILIFVVLYYGTNSIFKSLREGRWVVDNDLVLGNRPYQEFLQVIPFVSSRDESIQGDHGIVFQWSLIFVVILSEYSCQMLCISFLIVEWCIVQKKVQKPMKFRLSTDKYVTYCSVKEFSSVPGIIQMPQWVSCLLFSLL